MPFGKKNRVNGRGIYDVAFYEWQMSNRRNYYLGPTWHGLRIWR